MFWLLLITTDSNCYQCTHTTTKKKWLSLSGTSPLIMHSQNQVHLVLAGIAKPASGLKRLQAS